MNLTYPAIITQENDVFYIGFPDFKYNNNYYIYSTYGDSFDNALEMGKEWITLALSEIEDTNETFPKASNITELKKNLKSNQDAIYFTFNYEYVKSLTKLIDIKKL